MELAGRRPRGRPERRFMDAVKCLLFDQNWETLSYHKHYRLQEVDVYVLAAASGLTFHCLDGSLSSPGTGGGASIIPMGKSMICVDPDSEHIRVHSW